MWSKDRALAHLRENWDNTESQISYLGVGKLINFYKCLKQQDVINVLNTFEAYSLMKNTRYSKTSNPTLAYHVRDSMQGNLDNTLTIILIFLF